MSAPATLELLERGEPVSFSFEDMLRYSGPGSPGGVAHAFKVMERAFPLLDGGARPERREIAIATPFGGPGARDGFELVTRAVTDGRYEIDAGLARPQLGSARERFVFRIGYRGGDVTLLLREGFVTDEFVALAGKERGPQEEARLDALKAEMAERVMSSAADAVYDVTGVSPAHADAGPRKTPRR